MKTFKELKEALSFSSSDKTPSFKSYSITIPTIKRSEAVSLLKKEKIRYTSRGSSSGEFIFNDAKQAQKALEIFNGADIKIMDSDK